jgi:hypothetical protein
MSGLLGLTLIAVVVTICIFILCVMLEENVNSDFPSMLIALMWCPLAALWGASWILGWLS